MDKAGGSGGIADSVTDSLRVLWEELEESETNSQGNWNPVEIEEILSRWEREDSAEAMGQEEKEGEKGKSTSSSTDTAEEEEGQVWFQDHRWRWTEEDAVTAIGIQGFGAIGSSPQRWISPTLPTLAHSRSGFRTAQRGCWKEVLFQRSLHRNRVQLDPHHNTGSVPLCPHWPTAVLELHLCAIGIPIHPSLPLCHLHPLPYLPTWHPPTAASAAQVRAEWDTGQQQQLSSQRGLMVFSTHPMSTSPPLLHARLPPVTTTNISANPTLPKSRQQGRESAERKSVKS